MKRWDWDGAVALVLAFGFATTLVIIAGPWGPLPRTDTESHLLSTLGGAMIGALATYLGGHWWRHRGPNGDD